MHALNTAFDIHITIHATIQLSKGPSLVAQSNRRIKHVTWGLRCHGMASEWTYS